MADNVDRDEPVLPLATGRARRLVRGPTSNAPLPKPPSGNPGDTPLSAILDELRGDATVASSERPIEERPEPDESRRLAVEANGDAGTEGRDRLLAFLGSGPDVELDLERPKDVGREVEL